MEIHCVLFELRYVTTHTATQVFKIGPFLENPSKYQELHKLSSLNFGIFGVLIFLIDNRLVVVHPVNFSV